MQKLTKTKNKKNRLSRLLRTLSSRENNMAQEDVLRLRHRSSPNRAVRDAASARGQDPCHRQEGDTNKGHHQEQRLGQELYARRLRCLWHRQGTRSAALAVVT